MKWKEKIAIFEKNLIELGKINKGLQLNKKNKPVFFIKISLNCRKLTKDYIFIRKKAAYLRRNYRKRTTID